MYIVSILLGKAVFQLVDSLHYKPEIRGFICRCVIGILIDGHTVGSAVDSASKINECTEFFVGVNTAVP